MDTSHINDRIIAELLQGDEDYELINMARCDTAGFPSDIDVDLALAVERALECDGSGIILYESREHSDHLDIPIQPRDAPAPDSSCDVTSDEELARALQDLENEDSTDEEEHQPEHARSPTCDPTEDLGGVLIDEEANFQRPETPPPPWFRAAGQRRLSVRTPSPVDDPAEDLHRFMMDEEANFLRPETPPFLRIRTAGQWSVPAAQQPHDDDLEQCPICREKFGECDNLKQERCGHLFHPTCIDPWRRQNETCPVCRADL